MIEKNFTERHRDEQEALQSLAHELENYKNAQISDRRIETPGMPPNAEIAMEYFWKNKKELYDRAFSQYRKVIKEGLSYRYFGVGSAAVVLNENTGQYEIIEGYNEKEGKGIPKHCGEMKIVEQARARGFTKIVGIVVVAENQIDPSGYQCTTLRPCRECRNMLSPHAGAEGSDRPGNDLTWDGMPIVSLSIPPDAASTDSYTLVEEISTVAETIAQHDLYHHKLGHDPTKDDFGKQQQDHVK